MEKIIKQSGVIQILESVTCKRMLLELLCESAGEAYGLNAGHILKLVMQRESLGTTGVGKGVGIPHASLENLQSSCGAMVITRTPIDYEAIDGELVDVSFLLLAPLGMDAANIKILSNISYSLRNKRLLGAIRACKSSEDVYKCLCSRSADLAA